MAFPFNDCFFLEQPEQSFPDTVIQRRVFLFQSDQQQERRSGALLEFIVRDSDRFDTLTAHVTLERGRHGTDVCRSVAECLKKNYGLSHVTIQPEPPPPDELVPVRISKDGAAIRQIG